MDHPSYCGLSTDLCVPHSSHCCACLLEVSMFPSHAETDDDLKHVWNDVFLVWSCVFYFVGCYGDTCIGYLSGCQNVSVELTVQQSQIPFFLCREIRLVVAMIEPAVMSTDIFTVSLSLSHQERWSWEKSSVRLNVIFRCLFSSFVVLQKGDKVV